MKTPPGRKIFATLLLGALVACESSSLSVDGAEVAQIRVAPEPARVELESSMRLSAQMLDAAGNPVSGRPLFWTSENTAIARVSAEGEVTGVATGSTRVAASADGTSGVTTVTVVPRVVMKVTVSPPSTTLVVGQGATLTAAVLDRADKPIEGRAVTWFSPDSLIASVAPNGAVSARAEGRAVIRATSEGVTGEAIVVVTLPPVATVEVSPSSGTMTVGDAQKLAATARAADGTALDGRVVAWSSSNPGVVAVHPDEGLAMAVGVGVAVITALVEGRTGTATLTVAVRQVATVEVSPSSAQIFVAGTQHFTAIPKASDGSTLTGRSIVWSSSDAGVARVDAIGLVTAVATGQATVTATVEGKSGSAAVTVSRAPVATVEVNPTAGQILVGGTRQLVATTRDAGGRELTGREVTWSSGAPGIATVSAGGLVTGVSAGSVTLTATSETKTGSAVFVVTAVPVATVAVTPSPATVGVGATLQLGVTLRSSDGTVLVGRIVNWTSSAPSVASVNGGGLVAGNATGQATITATSEGISGSASLTVNQPVATVQVTPATATLVVGATQQFTAATRAANGTVLTGRTVTWTSSAPSVASVNGSSGLATANAAGTANIVATSEGKADTAVVTVTPKPVATIEVTPASSTIAVGATQQLTATLKASDASVLTGRVVTWTSGSPTIASVNGSGLVTGLAGGGPVTITAASEGKSGTASVTVFVPVATVTVTPGSATLSVGGTQQFTATLRSASGAVLTGRPVTWSSTAPSVASVNGSGLASAVAAGQANIIATSEGKADTSSVTVNAVPVATVEVTPSSAQLFLGGTQQLTATLRASNGTVLTGRPVTWTSSAPTTASVSATGLVTSLAAGNAKITATSEGKSDDSDITVILPVATVTVTPASFSLKLGQHDDLTATARAANGTVLTGRAVTWTSSNPLVATVNSNGRVQAILVGQATITATVEGVPGTSTVTVTLTEEALEESAEGAGP